jgi:AraC-like DNA-binding protein
MNAVMIEGTEPSPQVQATRTLRTETDQRNLSEAKQMVALLEAVGSQLGEVSQQVVKLSIVHALSVLLAQMDFPRPLPPHHTGQPILPAWRARRLSEYIELNIGRPLRMADLSSFVNLSPSHFSRAFKRTFRLSPHAYLMRRRVELASRLMIETAASLSDIALQCGLCDQSHLGRLFRRHMGVTPAQWRRHQEPARLHRKSEIIEPLSSAHNKLSAPCEHQQAP